MDLTTTYLGLKLRNPLVVSASPLSESIDRIRHMEDFGASAVVLYSLFEEQLMLEQKELHYHTTWGTESFAESLTYFPEPGEYKLGPDEYLEHIRKAKEAVSIPIIPSLNGHSIGGWTDYAAKIEQAGADALELNIYYIPTDLNVSGDMVEEEYLEIVKAVRSSLTIPVAIKLSPFFTNMANMAGKLDKTGVNGMVLFNRFFQPDIDLDNLEITPNVVLSKSFDIRLPMRWIAILYGRVKADLASTSGVHTGWDVIKMMMVGAKVAMLNSVLLKKGLPRLEHIEKEIMDWMEEHEYESIRQMQGSMSQQNIPDPSSFERAQYMKALTHFHL